MSYSLFYNLDHFFELMVGAFKANPSGLSGLGNGGK